MPALKDYPKEDRPNSTVVFWSFRLMVGMGVLMIFPGWLACGYATDADCIIRGPLCTLRCGWGRPLIAILAGWVTTEVGRQPWVVYGLLRTRDAVSAHSTLQMSISLLAFFVVYSRSLGLAIFI